MPKPEALSSRGRIAKLKTFFQFVQNQRRNTARVRSELSRLDPDSIHLNGGEAEWSKTGFHAKSGENFRVIVSGHLWLAKPLSLAFNAGEAVWVRIGGSGPIRKVFGPETVFCAWANGPVEVMAKGLSFWTSGSGAYTPRKRKAAASHVGVQILPTSDPADMHDLPQGWEHHWQIGEGRVFGRVKDGQAAPDDSTAVSVDTQGDVGILCYEMEREFKPGLTLSWEWLIENLPSPVAEDLVFTHDYLSIAVEFDNGLDLTYMWSAELPTEHVFQCPLDGWCDLETHWVIRSGEEGLGQWLPESRDLWADYPRAISGALPYKVVKVWLIANSIFARRHAKAAFRNIKLG